MPPTTFDSRTETLGQGAVRVVVETGGCPLRYLDVLDLWEENEEFRSVFTSILAGVSYRAFRWETPPLTAGVAERPFEFVMLDASSLACEGDPAEFSSHFESSTAGDGIVTFPNLGGDALLVVPEPQGPEASYGHLAAFTRLAPPEQNHALWRVVGRTMKQRLGKRPIWLGTAGGGVPWLHVRLDDRPKYYGHRPYAEEGERDG